MKGFDNLPINQNLSLSITMEEYTGVAADLTHDRSRYFHPMALNGPPTWAKVAWSNLSILDFDSTTPDWLDCSVANTVNLAFTTEDFSGAGWICLDSLAANRSFICKGLLNTDGWYLQVLMDGSLAFYTNQAAAFQATQSAAGDIVINTWYLIGWSRDGASVHLYVNGIDVTAVAGVHVNPVAGARELHIGIYDNEVGSPWEGRIWNPRLWGVAAGLGRALTQQDHQYLFETERHWFNV